MDEGQFSHFTQLWGCRFKREECRKPKAGKYGEEYEFGCFFLHPIILEETPYEFLQFLHGQQSA